MACFFNLYNKFFEQISGFIIVYDTAKYDSINVNLKWITLVREYSLETPMILVGNKIDLY